MELMQSLGLAGRVQLELKRQRWLDDVAGIEVAPTDPELSLEIQGYLADLGLDGPLAVHQWMSREGLSDAELAIRARRHQLWLKVCEQQYGKKLASYFLKRKSELDEVIYTVLPIAEQELCSELYMQVKEGETSFESLLQQLPPQPELGLRGQQGPVPLADLPEGLAQLLRVSQPGKLWPPKPIQQGWLLVRLEESRPAVLDKRLRRSLLLELGYQSLNQDE